MSNPNSFFQSLSTLPNLLTSFRFVAAPGLLGFAWLGYERAFMVLLALVFFSDVLDGMAARLTGQVTEFGATLDSLADLLTYMTIAVCSFWLWPELVMRELLYVLIIVGSCIAPPAAGMIKFGRLTSYHTWLVKLAAVLVGVSLFILFLGGPAWPLQIAAIVSLCASVEELAITVLLHDPTSNVRSLWYVLRKHKQ
ncbi:CDP-alcohol phosphatidyltransferase family protein [Methylomicrobium sp. Wu6]|uniref:CDP-alcohol phosphatidyltransferase family protein n=1 Tax=Methylomicrobium sp. Wu6 TaxID=3107928 RepID=UPI002DD67DDD|nr:CDP-alcohol phosphatidyltransferase family protein [Methylomicrobium sp. Wu6]MEC4748364.1 CDP-alcohol phosphatidyltransferase family protein [Methylomicrobium sp. Wu6]